MRRGVAVGIVVAALSAAGPAIAQAAPITVTSLADEAVPTVNMNCTLREAIEAANTNVAVDECDAGEAAAPDTITFAVSGPIVLTGAAGGDLDIEPDTANGPLVIDGNGPAATVVNASNVDRVIDVLGTGTVDLTLKNLTLRDGNTPDYGGGINAFLSGETVKIGLENSVVTSNEAAGFIGGGGIVVSAAAGSELDLVSSTISDNKATDPGGNAAGVVIGGTVAMTMDASTVSGNVNSGVYGGGIMLQHYSTLTAENGSRITGNHANGAVNGGGGGVWWAPAAMSTTKIVIRDSEVSGNSATNTAGAIYHADFDFGQLELDGATLAGNSARYAPALNTSSLRAVNTTISGNTATDPGDGGGGGLELATLGTPGRGTAEIRNSTIADNYALGPGDAINLYQAASVTLTGSVIADDPTDGDAADACDPGGTGTIGPGGGHNVDDGSSCGFGAALGNLSSTDAQLEPLDDYGGQVRTRALMATSPAIDLLPASDCDQVDGTMPLSEDARGFPRPFPAGGACDSGAYERFVCDGNVLDEPGPFPGCPGPPMLPVTPVTTPPASLTPAAARKKCKKGRKLKRGKCVKKKKRKE